MLPDGPMAAHPTETPRIQGSVGSPSTVPAVSSNYARGAVIGVVAGVIAGLFGVGGGIIVVPGLVLWIGISQRQASGTSIATIIASSAAALISFHIAGNVEWVPALIVFVGAAVGAVIGARLATVAPERILTATFAVVLFVAGIRMLL